MSNYQLTARQSHQSTTVDDAFPFVGVMTAIADLAYRSPGAMYENFRTNEADKKRLHRSEDWQLREASSVNDDAEVFSASSRKFGTVKREFSQKQDGVPYAVTQTFTLPATVEQTSIAGTPAEGRYIWWDDLDSHRFSHFIYKDATSKLFCYRSDTSHELEVTYSNKSLPTSEQPSCVTALTTLIEQRLSTDTGGVGAITDSRL